MPTNANTLARQTGLGAIPYAEGVAFRVWAPHAEQVYLVGSFNDWNETSLPLGGEQDGYWSIEVPGAKAGEEYKYLIQSPTGHFSRIDPYARQVTHSAGNGIIYDPEAFDWGNDAFQMAAWNEWVIYELHIGTFHVKEQGRPGSFASAIEQLPYLQALGINAIELMPVMEFSGDFSWGYNPSHPFAVKSIYGGPDGLKCFVQAAHAHGIAIIIDVVYNHFGPADLDLWQFDGWGENDKGGIYFYNDRRSQTPCGETRPDYSRGEVRQYLHDNVMMWLEEYRVDGLRWDSITYIKNISGGGEENDIPEGWSLLQWLNEEIHQRFPAKISIAEDMKSNIKIDVAARGIGFNALWDGEFVNPIRQAIISPDDASRDIEGVCKAIAHRFALDAFGRIIFTESHDADANGQTRVPEAISPGNVDNWFSKKLSTLGAALVLTSPGIPMLFQGQELLEDRCFQDKDPIAWSQVEEENGILRMYKDLIALRRNLSGVTQGLCGQNIHIYHSNNDSKLIAFHRWDKQGSTDSVVVVVNMANQNHEGYVIGFPRTGLWIPRFNSDSHSYSPNFANYPTNTIETSEGEADGLPCFGEISIGAYTVVIFSQDD